MNDSLHMRAIGSKGGKASGRSRRRRRDILTVASIILEGKFDLTKNASLKEAFDSVNFFGNGLDEDAKNTALESAIIAIHAVRGLEGDLNSAKWIFDIAGKSPYGKKVKLEIKKLELEVEQLDKMLNGEESKPASKPNVPEEQIEASLSRMGVLDGDR